MPYPEHDLIDIVKALPAQRQREVREFNGLLTKSDEIIAAAMAWITAHLPDRYCADEPHFDMQTLSWRIPVLKLVDAARQLELTGTRKHNLTLGELIVV